MCTRVILKTKTQYYNCTKPTGTVLRRAVHTQDGRRDSIIYESTTSIYVRRAPRAIYYQSPARALPMLFISISPCVIYAVRTICTTKIHLSFFFHLHRADRSHCVVLMYSNRRFINRRPPPTLRHQPTVLIYPSPRTSWSVKLTNSSVITNEHGRITRRLYIYIYDNLKRFLAVENRP